MTNSSFEFQISRLEEIVVLLDLGSSPIEELLNLYEEGMILAKQCRTYLETAEQRVILIANPTKKAEPETTSDSQFDLEVPF